MSDFIRAMNLLKIHRASGWLTFSQKDALLALQRTLRVPCSVNLFGSAGTGKTFLAWILAAEMDFAYFPHLRHLQKTHDLPETGIIVDNCAPERKAHRNVLKVLSFRDVSHAVLISRQPIRDYTHYVALELTPRDQAHVWHNLMTIGIFRETDIVPNLWHLLNPHL